METRRNLLLLLWALVASALAVAYGICTRQAQTAPTRPFGRYTARQMLDRTEPLCRALDSEASGLIMTAEGFSPPADERGGRPHWTVNCAGEAGSQIAYFIWDAETGALEAVGHRAREASGSAKTPLDGQAAQMAAWYWLRTLGMAGQAARWRIARAPERSGGLWRVRWAAEGRSALVTVDIYSGDLINARSWQQK